MEHTLLDDDTRFGDDPPEPGSQDGTPIGNPTGDGTESTGDDAPPEKQDGRP